ncbi:PREDICTED: uncharacterized protein LOC105960350 isoform X2 [Erythranthe guttata]|uniref:uncharacterized protein LOC105960350 isoform X2 n=1 Tax=Erythranthe guttata TaxID=4155 RepID=UPI00064DC0BF|nr:PREDICTED: uncharacterized protein LOC105960350 isoform X2 [Erythranthe guttata]|eukprot:XP_012840459.1 PREDICTED: uncharacterized protein LOC105960350 isoform X2 [Erythranthe guttata]
MVANGKTRCSKKRKSGGEITQAVIHSNAQDGIMQANLETCRDTSMPSENSLQQYSNSLKEMNQEDVSLSEDSTEGLIGSKKTRGPTKMRKIAIEPGSRVHVDFTDKGQPCGDGSIKLSSYLGPLARFDVGGEWKKEVLFRSMGCQWRASKSRLVKKIREAKNEEERLQLQPKNIQNRAEWRKFVREKISSTFTGVSEKYKAMRRKQIPHTCSRKGMARLAEDMKINSAASSSVSRVKVWIKSRTKKDGTPVNTTVSETIEKLNEFEIDSPSSSTTNVREDSLTKVLGQDRCGRVRGMGREMTMSKLALFQIKSDYVAEMEERIKKLENIVNTGVKDKIQENAKVDKIPPKVVNTMSVNKCKLLDWLGTEDIVAEGHLISDDPEELVDKIPLGPNALKVCVDNPNKPDAFLWRPTTTMTCMQQAQGEPIAWPVDRVIIQTEQHSERRENTSSHSNTSRTRCILFDWSGKNEIVAEGFLQSSDPNALVNNIPLGPNAMIVCVDVAIIPEAFLWRPTVDLVRVKDAVNSAIAWPASNVILEKSTETREENRSSPTSVNTNNVRKKCKLLDIRGSGEVVAEGRVSSSDPNELVHFVPLGPNAMRIWIDTVKVSIASLWRPTSEMEFMEDAFGTTVAWPSDKVIIS